MFQKYCRVNYRGSISCGLNRSSNFVADTLSTNKLVARCVLKRINAEQIEAVDDSRFSRFTTKLWPQLYEGLTGGYNVLFCSSYFEWVRLRAFFKSKNASVAFVSEYSERADA